jgi:pilus assembly protein Flp/PilA
MISRLYTIFDEEGQGLVEYALIIVLVAIALVTVLTLLKGNIANVFNSIGNTLQSGISGS